MTEKWDNISRLLLGCINILFLKNPERTVLGVLLGSVFCFLSKVFEPSLAKMDYISFSKVQIWEFIPFGVVVSHLPYVIWSIFNKPSYNDDVDNVLELIESSNFSEKEKRQMYRNLVNKCINSLSLDKKRHLARDVNANPFVSS